MIHKWSVLAGFILVVGACGQPFTFPIPGSETTGPHQITGTVYNGTGPATLVEASVQLFGPVNKSTRTDASGGYSFSSLPAGDYRIEVDLHGYFVYSAAAASDSRQIVDGIEVKNFNSEVFNPVGDIYKIPEIQGRAHLSPFVNQEVTNVVGIVTGVEFQEYYKLAVPWYGIYIQTKNSDGDEKTSEGLFIYIPLQDTSFSVPVGSLVNIKRGIVEENRYDFSFLDYGYDGNLSRTWIRTSKDNVEILLAGTGPADSKIPPAISVGVTPATGKRIIPARHAVIEGTIEAESWDFNPALNAVDFWESLEGMLITMSNLKVVEPTSQYGDIYVSPDGGSLAQTTAAGGALLQSYNETNARTIQIIKYEWKYRFSYLDYPAQTPSSADSRGNMPLVNTGSTIGSMTGLVDYSRNTFMVRTLALSGAVNNMGVIQEDSLQPGGDATNLLVATMNLENFAKGDSRALTFKTEITGTRLNSPDIIGLVEVQDDSGEQDDGTVSGAGTLGDLLVAGYAAMEVAPLNNRNGGAPGANIRPAILYRTNRTPNLTFNLKTPPESVDPAQTSVQVTNGPTGPELGWNPGLIGAGEDLFDYTRKPLVAQFIFNGKKVFFIAAHLNSKIGDGAFFGPYQPILRPSEEKRHQRAEYISNFVREIKALDPAAIVIIVGDFNDYHFSRTLLIFEEAGLFNLHNKNAVNERYTYIHLGNSQSLDHILVSNNAVTGSVLDVVRRNRDVFYDETQSNRILSDHEPVVARIYIP